LDPPDADSTEGTANDQLSQAEGRGLDGGSNRTPSQSNADGHLARILVRDETDKDRAEERAQLEHGSHNTGTKTISPKLETVPKSFRLTPC
jgi:hypothetical protein